jgi:cyclohexyl-isocyanide hydratase
MDFAGATQVFATPFGFKPIWISNEKTITTSEGVTVVPNYNFDNCPPIDILFVPGGSAQSTVDAPLDGVPAAMQNQPLIHFIQRSAKTAIWKGSVCTGAFILAAAGVLNHTRATTYWSQIPVLGLLSGKFKLKISKGYPRFVFDKKNRIFTGGGISSSLDLSLEIVRIIKGKRIAELTQLFIQYQPQPSINAGDPQHAPKAITNQLRKADQSFTQVMTQAVEKLL